MVYRQVGLALLMTLAFGGGASAGFVANDGGGSWIDIRPDESESDKLLGLSCGLGFLIDTHLGGIFDIGKGGHEAVSVTLTAGKLSAKVKGLSVETPDAEMTGGIELLTTLKPDDGAFAVLTSGKEITLQSGGKSEKFTLGKKSTDALKAFLKKCS